MDNMVGKIRILLADSDGDFCAEMAALCENAEDMELVGIAESGEKALTAVGELRPDLLITELSLPGMDGVLLLEQLRAAGNMPAVFVLSASSKCQVRRSFAAAPPKARSNMFAAEAYMSTSAAALKCLIRQ